MKTALRIEEAFLFLLAVFLFYRLPFAWWWFPLLLFVPDVGMVGYAAGPRVGAVVYNAVHHRALAVALYLLGFMVSVPILQLAGIILFAHSTLDRVFHYGLKFPDRFSHTHLSD
jgi:hypothetical protein